MSANSYLEHAEESTTVQSAGNLNCRVRLTSEDASLQA